MARDKKQRSPTVVSRHGKYRFQTGMITAALLQHGVEMEHAFRLAKMLRQRVSGRDTIGTDELEDELRDLVLEELGRDLDDESVDDPPSSTTVLTSRGRLPFSRGVLLRPLVDIGVDPEKAIHMLDDLQGWVAGQDQGELDEEQIERRLARELLRSCGRRVAERYRLLRWFRAPARRRPVLIFLGGATGTGKSTLAMELAARLGVRHVISTDIVRETMRSVVSPSFVPGLHDHSFRGVLQGGQALSDPRERVLAGFSQQAAQVSVGVRAVVKRLLAEQNDAIIEGTHLVPPFHELLPAPDVAHAAGLLLGVPHEAHHLARFPARATRQKRAASAYLDAFQSVRWIHDALLAAADEGDCLVLGETEARDTVLATIDFLAQALELDAVPPAARPPELRSDTAPPSTLTVILDGLPDEPHVELDGLTPLEAADTPLLDLLAASGAQGQLIPAPGRDGVPHTESAVAALLGIELSVPLGRGLCDALGAGISIQPGSVVLRGNVATIEPDGRVLDRRAGRPRSGVPELLRGLEDIPLRGGLRGAVRHIHEHRVSIAITGPGLSSAVSNSDPGDRNPNQVVHPPRPLDDTPEAARTAEALRQLLAIASKHFARHPLTPARAAAGLAPITGLLSRGAARVSDRFAVSSKLGDTAIVAGCRTTLGLARLGGLTAVTHPSMTANVDTDLERKFETAGALLNTWRHVVVHVKGTDIAAHDRRPKAKRDLIEAVDRALRRFLEGREDPLRVLVTADHATSSTSGAHMRDPVPLLWSVWPTDGEPGRFDEGSASDGALGTISTEDLHELVGANVVST